MIKEAVLALESGRVYRGIAFGAKKTWEGELVFNTSRTGYQEILTDPSYWGQIVTMTTPHIGNYGINQEDVESSNGPKVRGLVVRECSPIDSNWRSTLTLSEYLEKFGIPGIEDVDTRSITKAIREEGAVKACLSTEGLSDAEAVERARCWEGLVGFDFAEKVTCSDQTTWDPKATECQPFRISGTGLGLPVKQERPEYSIVAVDFGAKNNIFHRLRAHRFKVTVVPADTSADQIRSLDPDGVFLSNGPGDPAAVPYAHRCVGDLLGEYPIFGICMGHQILTHALGAKTYKLKFGHRGANQPVLNIETGTVAITAQNHGFATDRESLEKAGGVVTHVNLNDQTVAGLRHKTLPVFSVQHHPEASPGPHDTDDLFEDFYQMIQKNKSCSNR